MNQDQLISIHAFNQQYLDYKDSDAFASVYLTIYHTTKTFSIAPKLPYVGDPDYTRMRSDQWQGIEDIAVVYKDISADFSRAIALQACTFRATLFAIETLALAKPTEIEAAKRLFTEDNLDSMHCKNHAAS